MKFVYLFLALPFLIKAQFISVEKLNAASLPLAADTIEKYSTDDNEWMLVRTNQEAFITPYLEDLDSKGDSVKIADSTIKKIFRLFPEGKRCYLKTDDGIFIGVYNGTYRGGLFWIANDFSSGYQISSQKILKFIKSENNVYAIQSFPNLDVSKGNIIELKKTNSKYMSFEFVDLPSAPIDICSSSSGLLYVLTANPVEVVCVNQNKELSAVVADELFDKLPPHNMLLNNDDLYISMRKGIYKYNLTAKKAHFLQP